MYFEDRYDAAKRLLPFLKKYKQTEGVILAVPRGGVPLGYIIALHLHLPLDLLMTKKIGHPDNEEFAIGAVGLKNSIVEERHHISEEYLKAKITYIRRGLQKKYKSFMGDRKPEDIEDKTVIVIDDGVATGRTILSTLKMLRKRKPKKLVVAVPVASGDAAKRIRREVDEFVCLYTPEPFFGVSYFYHDFDQVTDEEVKRLLKELNERKHSV